MIVLFTDVAPSQYLAASHLAKAAGGRVKWQPPMPPGFDPVGG